MASFYKKRIAHIEKTQHGSVKGGADREVIMADDGKFFKRGQTCQI